MIRKIPTKVAYCYICPCGYRSPISLNLATAKYHGRAHCIDCKEEYDETIQDIPSVDEEDDSDSEEQEETAEHG